MPVKTYGIGGGRSTFKGFSTGNVTDISAESGARKVFLKWRDPEDAILNDVVVSAWAGTIIVRKTGGYPESVKDGIQILDSKVRNAYLTEAYVDEDVEAGTEYFYRFFPYSTENVFNYESYNTAKCIPISANPIFSEATWDEVVQACNTHTVPESWNIGDTKNMRWGGSTVSVKICGKKFDDLADGSGKAELSFCIENIGLWGYFYPYQSSPYLESSARETVISYLNNFPEIVRNNIKEVTKKERHYSAGIQTSTETIFVLSARELGGRDSTEGSPYPIFSDDNSRIMTTGGQYWTGYYMTRSSKNKYYGSTMYFCYVEGYSGDLNDYDSSTGISDTQFGLRCGFCL